MTRAGGSISRVAKSLACQIDAVYWLQASVPPHVSHTIGLPTCRDMAAGFLQSKWPKREREEARVTKIEVTVFLKSNLKSDIMSLLPYSIDHTKQHLVQCGREYTECKCQELGSL